MITQGLFIQGWRLTNHFMVPPSQLSPQFLRSSRDTGSSCEMATANEKAGEITWEMFYVFLGSGENNSSNYPTS